MSSVFVVNVEKLEETNVIGVYATEKLAKDAAINYVENCDNVTFKRKQIKKDSTDLRKVLFLQDLKVAPMSITISQVTFDFSKVKHKKEKKDTPHKCLSAFIIFNKENREKIKAANPDVTFGELGKLIGDAWKSLNETDKSVYQQKSEADKQRYQTEMDKYTETH
jgi:hypothetical protein